VLISGWRLCWRIRGGIGWHGGYSTRGPAQNPSTDRGKADFTGCDLPSLRRWSWPKERSSRGGTFAVGLVDFYSAGPHPSSPALRFACPSLRCSRLRGRQARRDRPCNPCSDQVSHDSNSTATTTTSKPNSTKNEDNDNENDNNGSQAASGYVAG
jgi:hypothetical protein